MTRAASIECSSALSRHRDLPRLNTGDLSKASGALL